MQLAHRATDLPLGRITTAVWTTGTMRPRLLWKIESVEQTQGDPPMPVLITINVTLLNGVSQVPEDLVTSLPEVAIEVATRTVDMEADLPETMTLVFILILRHSKIESRTDHQAMMAALICLITSRPRGNAEVCWGLMC